MPGTLQRSANLVLNRLGLSNRSHRERAYGRSFVVPIVDGRKACVSEQWMAQMIDRLFSVTPGAFIDVGANLGETLLKVAAADPTRRYIGFEPDPVCAAYVAELIRANDLPYTLIPAALGAKPRLALLHPYSGKGGNALERLVADARGNRPAIDAVVVLSLGELPDEQVPDEIAIVKIGSANGYADVLDGIEPLLRKQRPFLVAKILPADSGDDLPVIERQQQVERRLCEADYKMFRIRCDERERFQSIELITAIGIRDEFAVSDYMMVPNERIASLAVLGEGFRRKD